MKITVNKPLLLSFLLGDRQLAISWVRSTLWISTLKSCTLFLCNAAKCVSTSADRYYCFWVRGPAIWL